MPTREDELRAILGRLNPEQRQQFLSELEKQRSSAPAAPPRAEAGMMGGGEGGPPPDTTELQRFAGGVWKNINPVEIVKGLATAVANPIDTVQGAVGAMGNEWEKAGKAGMEGRYSEAVGHGLAGTIPFIGPAAAAAGERIGTGDVAGGLGEGVGLLVPTLVPRGVSAAVKGLRQAGVAGKVGQMLEGAAAEKVAKVMSPEVGPNKLRFGNKARKIAPELTENLAAEGAPITKGGFHADIKTRLAEAQAALDEAADARLASRTFDASPILKTLEQKRAALASKSVEGKSVVPGPNSARVAVIDQAIDEISKLKSPYGEVGGPKVGYDAIRTMRQAYDGQAKVTYNPSMTADFLKQKGAALGASDVAGVLRDNLAQWDPATAGANARYSLYRAADDVMTAAAEVERVRPKVGRQIMSRLTLGVLGGQQAGPAGAAVGYLGAPIIDAVLASGVTTQLKAAALMKRFADAIRSGNIKEATSLNQQLKQLGQTATIGQVATSRRQSEGSGLPQTAYSPTGQ